MQNLLSLTLIAHNPDLNHHRHYSVTVGRDLLNDWTVSIVYGRVGQRGQEKRYAGADPLAMAAIISDRLRRRLSAPRRIGCPYRLAILSNAAGFDAEAWLPGQLMDGFAAPDGFSTPVHSRSDSGNAPCVPRLTSDGVIPTRSHQPVLPSPIRGLTPESARAFEV